MPSEHKNIVICLDGTGNQIKKNLSNVLKLYRVLEKSEKQVVYYDQGVGTLGRHYTWGRQTQKLKNVLGLGFGLGLDENVLQAYNFIVEHYKIHKVGTNNWLKGDNIFIFGFSRGAHTARVLAGMLHEVGILRPEQIHLSGAALSAYKQSATTPYSGTKDVTEEGDSANFRRVTGAHNATVRFLGAWDTVSSVFVPNQKGFWPLIVREKLPHTHNNRAVRTFRHAIAIDEKRRMFRVDHWGPEREFKPNKHSKRPPRKQDAQEMWFPGYHSDIGGGHERMDSGLAQFPFIWMIEEAVKAKLKVSSDKMVRYVSGQQKWNKDTEYLYPEPDVTARVHDSMKGFWSVIEWLPKSVKRMEWFQRKKLFKYYIPACEPRPIMPDGFVHPSAKDRMKADPDYRPENLIASGMADDFNTPASSS